MRAPFRRGDRRAARGAQASIKKTGDACASVVCARASLRCAQCHTTTPGRATRNRAASAVSASYTPSARCATHTTYVATATAAAQRVVRGAGLWFVGQVAGISFGLGLGLGLEHMRPALRGAQGLARAP